MPLASQITQCLNHADQNLLEVQDGVYLSRLSQPRARTTSRYDPVFCLLAQGEKIIRHHNQTLFFDEDHFLVTHLTLPVDVEIPNASPQRPLLGMALSLDLAIIQELQAHLPASTPTTPNVIDIHPVDQSLRDVFTRLLQSAQDNTEWQILGESLKRECHYRLLQSSAGPTLRAFLTNTDALTVIAKSIHHINTHLHEPMTVEMLAKQAGLSVSGFHNKFKQITSHSPIQYIKQLRLTRARTLIQSGISVTQAALDVGYQSPSQFSREFRRQYGISPSNI